MSLLSTCTTILDLTYQTDNLRDGIFEMELEIQRNVDSLPQVDTAAVLEEISSLKQSIRKQIDNLQLLENELEIVKQSLVEQMSIYGNKTMQIEIQHNPASGRPDDRIYQFTISNGALNWEIKK